jgi:predicted ribosomally synthesized peptide with nif11-like leader
MSSPQTEAELDQLLERFISLAKTDSDLKAEIKSALNQDEVIAIAHQRGFMIDSLTILRKWSKHTDFSQPTWMGWFED